ncbi:MAG: hypothetical protein ACKV2V_02690 [Blastocatellia bacterium]
MKLSIGNRMFQAVQRMVSGQKPARRIPVALPLEFAIVVHGPGAGEQRSRRVGGVATDLSLTGLAIETRTIHIGRKHILQSADMATRQQLEISLELGGRLLTFEGIPLRYERRAVGTGNYVVGIHITGMREQDRAFYAEYLDMLQQGPATRARDGVLALARREA